MEKYKRLLFRNSFMKKYSLFASDNGLQAHNPKPLKGLKRHISSKSTLGDLGVRSFDFSTNYSNIYEKIFIIHLEQ